MDNQDQVVAGAVKIGRNGTKLHPATKGPVYGLMILCSCPGTQQGRAYHGAKFFKNAVANCKN